MPIDEAERERRRALLHAHLAAENDHDLDRIMDTFAENAEMNYNRQPVRRLDDISRAHRYMGVGAEDGAFADFETIADREHFTDDEIVIEGRIRGRHVRDFEGFPATGREIELPWVAFYRFDDHGKLVSERIVMNLGTLGATPPASGG